MNTRIKQFTEQELTEARLTIENCYREYEKWGLLMDQGILKCIEPYEKYLNLSQPLKNLIRESRRNVEETRQKQKETKELERQVKDAHMEAKHNLGLVFNEKAERALEKKDYNAARLYWLHTLTNFDPACEGPEKAINNLVNYPSFPILFQTPHGYHHNSHVISVSFSQNGKTLASVSSDNTIRIWDVVSGREKKVFKGHGGNMIFSSDLTMVFEAYDKAIHIWDMKTGKERAVLTGLTGTVNTLCFSPDGKTLASGGGDDISSLETRFSYLFDIEHESSVDNTIRLWDLKTRKEKAVFKGHTDTVRCICFSPDAKILASSSGGNTIRMWDVETTQEKFELYGHLNSVLSISFSPDGKILASGSEDGKIRLWDVETGKGKFELSWHTSSVLSVKFSPDGNILASGSKDNTIRLWDAKNGRGKVALYGTSPVLSVNFSPDSTILASGTEDGIIRLWDVDMDRKDFQCISIVDHTSHVIKFCISDIETEGKNMVIPVVPADNKKKKPIDEILSELPELLEEIEVEDAEYEKKIADICSISFSPDSKLLAVGSYNNNIYILDMETGKEISIIDGHKDAPFVNFFPDGKTLLSKTYDNTNTISVWDIETGKEKAVFKWRKDSVAKVAFSPDGKILASGEGNTIRIWDVETGKEKSVLTGHTGDVNDLCFSPDGKTLASCAEKSDCTIYLWDVKTGKNKSVLIGHMGAVTSLCFSPDGKNLASGAEKNDCTIRIWDMEAGKEKLVLNGVEDTDVYNVRFSPDGRILISMLEGNCIMMWNIETGKSKTAVGSLSFSPDGKTFAYGRGSIHMCNTETGKEQAEFIGLSLPDQINFSPNGKALASYSRYDNKIHLWNLSLYNELKDRQLSKKEIKEAEQMYGMKLVNLELQPIPPERNLYKIKSQAPKWPKTHPFYWLAKARKGDPEALVQLGLTYERNNENPKALICYKKAVEKGSEHGKKRLAFLEKWMSEHD